LVENIGRSLDNSTYGIATVQPNRAIKKCRIRKLLVEYIINENAIILTLPKSCKKCACMDDCTDDFIIQIIQKIANKGQPPAGEAHYYIP
jgi:hypothetical protein